MAAEMAIAFYFSSLKNTFGSVPRGTVTVCSKSVSIIGCVTAVQLCKFGDRLTDQLCSAMGHDNITFAPLGVMRSVGGTATMPCRVIVTGGRGPSKPLPF